MPEYVDGDVIQTPFILKVGTQIDKYEIVFNNTLKDITSAEGQVLILSFGR